MDKSTKYDNFVYMAICEASLKAFTEYSMCTKYQNYCHLMKCSLKDRDLSNKELQDIAYIVNDVNQYFSMKTDTLYTYVMNFFLLEKFKKFEMPARYTMAIYTTNIGL